VYDELRKLAAQKLACETPGQTLQATALVHEAYVRLVDGDTEPHWDSRGHFFAAAAEAIRRILVDNARKKLSLRRGGSAKRQPLEHLKPSDIAPDEKILALDEALVRLQQHRPEHAPALGLRADGCHFIVMQTISKGDGL
jgi:RNA polymerase sigma factor (TIGR02999 family)